MVELDRGKLVFAVWRCWVESIQATCDYTEAVKLAA
jgi:hypothetical protein